MKISPKQYAKLIDEYTENAVGDDDLNKKIALIAGFVKRNRDQAILDKIVDEYDKLSRDKGGELLVQLENGKKLHEEQIEKIKEKISQKRGVASDKIQLVSIVNPKLIGGIRVKIGNNIIDGSIKSKLTRLQLSLT